MTSKNNKNLIIKTYLQEIQAEIRLGNATEHTHRPAIKKLIELLNDYVIAINEPKRKTFGAPDFIIFRNQVPVGYVETKCVNFSLDLAEQSDQFQRYLKSLNNIILTNYLEFRWYVTGILVEKVNLASLLQSNVNELSKNYSKLTEMMSQFINYTGDGIVSSYKDLAVQMAIKAKFIREIIMKLFQEPDCKESNLYHQFIGFRDIFSEEITHEKFADMYAQTICYGLFSACFNTNQDQPFTRQSAAYLVPRSNPFLRNFFNLIAGPELDSRVSWVVDDLAKLLSHIDFSIITGINSAPLEDDPIIYFYEDFLSEYDPDLKLFYGVYYTPEPIVQFITKSIDYLLKHKFSLPNGLADSSTLPMDRDSDSGLNSLHRVQILDPAIGTGTFIYNIVKHIYGSFRANKGMWPSYVSEHLLPRLFGFELLLAPYAIAHFKVSHLLNRTCYNFKDGERLRIYLTNTLDEPQIPDTVAPFANWLAQEAKSAGVVKRDVPVMVIVGNPPYLAESENNRQWIVNLLHGFLDTGTIDTEQSYFHVNGEPLNEQNSKWLNDDYVKFIKFSQWRITQTGKGILGFVCNNSYIDNPTFRGMRYSLLRTFNEIYIINLHGYYLEKPPQGIKNEGVFDIKQGVAVGIFVKNENDSNLAKVYYSDCWGTKEEKFSWLLDNNLSNIEWESFIPNDPFYTFKLLDPILEKEWMTWWKLDEAMQIKSVGITTRCDKITFSYSEADFQKKVRIFSDKSLADDELRQSYLTKKSKLSKSKFTLIRTALVEESSSLNKELCLYRPFDLRTCIYDNRFLERNRLRAMKHMLGNQNIALISARSNKSEMSDHFFCTKFITEIKCGESTKNSSIFPLYLYPSSEETVDSGEFTNIPNFSQSFISDLTEKLDVRFNKISKQSLKFIKNEITCVDIFFYFYAIFYSPTYRIRYCQFMKLDFPRIPLTKNKELFKKLILFGEKLVAIHLMEKYLPQIVTFPIPGDNQIKKISFKILKKENCNRLWINKNQYFEGINKDIWNFKIGGHQICKKWLEHRKGCKLSYEELHKYQQIISIIHETQKLMQQIDQTITDHGGWPLK